MSTTDGTSTNDFDRDVLHDEFLTVLNVVQPDHAYLDDPWPIDHDQVEYSFCQSTGRYYAKCGARGKHAYSGATAYLGDVVSFSADLEYFKRASPERRLAVYTHELTHVTQDYDEIDAWHPPSFWREMMFHAWQVRENLELIEAELEITIDEEQFCMDCIKDPNDWMVDKRYETVDERRRENAELLGFHDYEPEYDT